MDDLFWFFGHTGKVPIITNNAICFMLDRIFDNWCNEAAYLIDHAPASQIDKVAEEFVFSGPFFVLNMAWEPHYYWDQHLTDARGGHHKQSPILGSVDRWLTHRPGAKIEVPEDVRSIVRDRILGILFSQSFDIIDRGIGTREDLKFGCQIALGFKKGPFDVMRHLGEAKVGRIMKKFKKERPGSPGQRNPSP
ncbi:MAG: 3-hydroxyacyl-CoA dehydrogenase, partial [Candidatus Cloacimonetes bacterium 4572_55]